MPFDHVTISNDHPLAQEIVTVYAIFVRWIRDGFWDRILETLRDGCGRGPEGSGSCGPRGLLGRPSRLGEKRSGPLSRPQARASECRIPRPSVEVVERTFT
jgi:hypothetical protein